ncbi:twin-arginine translocase subunit TatB [Niveispirillum sp. SYP-B3756]|uniref:Sec-independent protein translocase protein TatB n=1 Tax=Niveispirillum sp. SYP-B3756 TaxID=2662178 RepID=UPI0012908F4C|nr:Sec-independent protein translocase protein TatB [Niveispirillum sp. SYP-B3756]MQP67804.1 twin-arginine translocase subunit TatB [Niveispirillum sp. SYP-B3756]
MFDIGWSEIAVIAVVALVVIGPKDLPKALHTVGKWVAKARSLAREFQNNVDDMVRQAELDELRKQVEQARSFNLNQELEKAIDPDGKLREPLGGPQEGTAKPATPVTPDPEEDADLAAVALPPPGAPPVTPLEPTPVASPATAVQMEPVNPISDPPPQPPVEPAAPAPVTVADADKPVEAPKTQGERP